MSILVTPDTKVLVQGMLVFLDALFVSPVQGIFHQRHIEAVFASLAPGGSGVGRADVASVELFNERLVKHATEFTSERRP